MLPVFLNLAGRRLLVVGGGPVAAAKLAQLLAAGAGPADVRVVAPEVVDAIEQLEVRIERRPFEAADLDGVWLVVAAAPAAVNRAVADAAAGRQLFVNAVDDPANASAFLGGVVRRAGVTIAISTDGAAPAMAGLLREGIDALLPADLDAWMAVAARQREDWRSRGVPMASRRPRLLEALNRLYVGRAFRPGAPGGPEGPPHIRRRKGRPGLVSLVGAGPGDPELLTRKAAARLRRADLVLYDALVDERVLTLAPRAQCFFVGKRAGRHAVTQDDIHAVMISAARRGRQVVRLKGGDPFLFGRGGEEALALDAAGVAYEVVPGVSSALAAPALAGIPVTHRGVSQALLVVGGFDEAAFRASVGAVAANGVTLVVLMGLARRTAIAAALVERGWRLSTPAAIVRDASREGQQVWRGTLGAMAAGAATIDGNGAATIVIGDVAAINLSGIRDQGSGIREKRA